MKRIRSAQTLCPVCLRRLEGAYEEDGDGAVYLSRTCPQHVLGEKVDSVMLVRH